MVYTIYVVATTACNMHCKHCYRSDNPVTISHDDLLNSVFKFIKDFANEHCNDTVLVQLHGGEIIQYDNEILIQFVKQLKTVDNIIVGITTNLVYKLTEQRLQLFDLIDDHLIQTSWDVDIRFDNDSQLQLWEHNVQKLLQLGYKVQPTICVTNQLIDSYTPKQLFDYLKSFGVSQLNFERITYNGRAKQHNIRPTNKRLNEWLLQAYIEYRNDRSIVEIPLFNQIDDSINRDFGGCRARKCTSTVLTINPDLSIASCPNTFKRSFNTVNNDFDQRKKIAIVNEELVRPNYCMKCQYYQYCNGDCFQLQQSSITCNDNTQCHGLYDIYDYIIRAKL